MDDAIVIGAGGMLGRAVCAELEGRGVGFVRLDFPSFDLASEAQVRGLAGQKPSLVINCAAWTDVDGAEEREPEATLLNGKAVGWLADACAECGATLVHYSTDYVFSGDSQEPYRIDHPRDPVNAYGRSKAAGEEALERSHASWILARTSWLYAPWGKNFVLTMRQLLSERDGLKVVDDQLGRPSSAVQVARRSIELATRGDRGVFHLCDSGECTWHGFASEIGMIIGSGASIEPCSTDAFPRPAKRPAYSVMDLSRADALLGPAQHWHDSLREALAAASAMA